jgi:hypothetical protein
MDNSLNYPYPIAENMDLIITTTEHAEEISALLGGSPKLVRIALRPESRCLSRIIRIRKEARVGILSHSERFGQVMRGTCEDYNHSIVLCDNALFSQVSDWENWLEDKDAVLGGSLQLPELAWLAYNISSCRSCHHLSCLACLFCLFYTLFLVFPYLCRYMPSSVQA